MQRGLFFFSKQFFFRYFFNFSVRNYFLKCFSFKNILKYFFFSTLISWPLHVQNAAEQVI